MEKFLTVGNAIFAAGMILEIIAIPKGVHVQVVGATLAMYGIAMCIWGYLQ